MCARKFSSDDWPANLVMAIFNDSDKVKQIDVQGLEAALATFPEGEYLVLRFKKGLIVRVISEKMNVTYDMARNRIDKALRKIRHPARIKMFYRS